MIADTVGIDTRAPVVHINLAARLKEDEQLVDREARIGAVREADLGTESFIEHRAEILEHDPAVRLRYHMQNIVSVYDVFHCVFLFKKLKSRRSIASPYICSLKFIP
jgi:hypothetical protein